MKIIVIATCELYLPKKIDALVCARIYLVLLSLSFLWSKAHIVVYPDSTQGLITKVPFPQMTVYVDNSASLL